MTPATATPPTTALVATAVSPEVAGALEIFTQLKPLKDALNVGNLTDTELQLFALVAKHTGLDPFSRQIYAVKRSGKVTHQTGIDGYRTVAERTGQYAGSDEAEFEDCTCGEEPKDHPKLARVVVHRIRPDGIRVDQVGVARWHELYPGKGDDGFMWRRMPHGQLAKCAEANGLRKAFPRTFGGVYISDEMQGPAAVVEGEATVVDAEPKTNQSTADRIAARRQARQTSPVTAAPPPTAEDVVEGSFTEASAEPTFADTVRAAAAASDLAGAAAKADVAAVLESTFKGWDLELIQDGLRALFGEEAVAKPTAAQVAALRLVGDSMAPVALLAAWRALGDGRAAS